jgi:hypothetical protein
MQMDYEIYKPNKSITFILTDSETIAMTNLQTFVIKYDHHNYSSQLGRLRDLIRSNKIQSPTDLVDFCNWRPGNNRTCQNYGLELVPTKIERYINV